MVESEASLLVAVMDMGLSRAPTLRSDPTLAASVLEAVIAFSNAHLMMKPSNRLAVLSCDTANSDWLYPKTESTFGASDDARQQDGQHEVFSEVERTVRRRIAELLTQRGGGAAGKGESLLAGALSRALCYIHRLNREQSGHKEKMNSRVLLVTASGDSASQYMNFMNVFFTAQKLGVLLDVCSLGPDSGLLQQGCDITGGQYLHVPQPQGLLQYLLWVFLPEPPLRKKLALPPPVRVDYRAACFCHRELVDIGFHCVQECRCTSNEEQEKEAKNISVTIFAIWKWTILTM
ncbi:hypothetical protein B566_EDAN010205 [Ephemera danica]|nr:hypothetical protein B566_EDAN010205 [Ephemera danica]